MNQKSKYITKNVQFGGKRLTLYSIDGSTWSTRSEELEAILERHEAQKVTAAHLRGEVIEGETVAQGAPKPQLTPKKKLPVGGFRRQPLQVPHPAYALSAEAGKASHETKKSSRKEDKERTKRVAASAKIRAKKSSAAAPKIRETSRPEAKKIQSKKRAAA